MKEQINIFAYSNYREFLVDWLKEREFSYRSFAARYQGVVSLIALARLLSRGRGGGKTKNDYRMSPEALARLGKAIHLSDDEMRQLLLLRLENDAEVLTGQHGNSFQRVMQELIAENRSKQAGKGKPGGIAAASKGSETGKQLFELFDLLPSRLRIRILEEAALQGRIYAARQSGKTGVKALNSLLRELERLKEMGAP